MKIFLSVVMMLIVVLAADVANAEIITVEGEGRYVADKMLNETIRACTEHARDEALRTATESVGVIVKSRSKAVNFKLTEDILETYAVSLLEGVKYFGEGYSQNAAGDTVFVCKVTATVDTSN